MKTRILFTACILALAIARPAAAQQQEPHALRFDDCSRACLEDFVNRYLQALVARDPSRLPLAPDARYTENGVELELGDGMWGPEIVLRDYRLYFADPQQGQVGFYGTLEEHGHPAILGLRLKVEHRRIAEIEAFLIRSTARGTFSDVDNMRANPLLTTPLTGSERRPRSDLVRIADSYFIGMVEGTDAPIPFADSCIRIENGVMTANNPDPEASMAFWKMTCREQFSSGQTKVVTAVRERRYPVVDEERGLVYAMARFDHHGRNRSITLNDGTERPVNTPFDEPFSFQIGELFKIVDGRIVHIDALVFPVPYRMPTGWAH